MTRTCSPASCRASRRGSRSRGSRRTTWTGCGAPLRCARPNITRLIENSWAQSEHSLITSDELQAATRHLVEPEIGQRGIAYSMGIDLGLTHDWTAMVIGHVDGVDGRFTVDVVRTWRGTPGSPVSLMAVEDEVVRLAQRFRPKRIVADQWQSAHLIERLQARDVENTRSTTIEPARLDKLTTMLKDLFAKRAITIPSRELDLLEQLEWLEVEEAGARNRRRDRIKFLPGGSDGAGAHDDIVIALALAAEVLQGEAGRLILPPMRTCLRGSADPNAMTACYLMRRGPGWYPPNNDPTVQPVCGARGGAADVRAVSGAGRAAVWINVGVLPGAGEAQRFRGAVRGSRCGPGGWGSRP